MRKIRAQTTTELDRVTFAHEEQMEVIRIKREEELVKIRHQLNEETEIIQIQQKQKMDVFYSKMDQCDAENDADQCRHELDELIDVTRAHYEEQEEITREEHDVEKESVRRQMDVEVEKIRVDLVNEITQIERDTDAELQRLRVERDNCKVDVLSCTDIYDDKIEGVRIKLEEDIRQFRLESNRVMERVVIQRNRQLQIIEMARKQEINALRIEWKRTCTDKCTLCREEQNGLLEIVHAKREDQLNGIRVHWDDQIMKFKVNQKRALDLIIKQRRVEIEKIAAERTKCPAIVANEAEICRQKVTVKMEHVHADEDAEIELTKEHHEQQRVKIVMEFEDKIDTLVADKRTQLHAIHVEREQVLKELSDKRHACEEEGEQKVENCHEEIEGQLIVIRNERDSLVDQQRETREADMDHIVSVYKQQLVSVEADLEGQLATLHDEQDQLLAGLSC